MLGAMEFLPVSWPHQWLRVSQKDFPRSQELVKTGQECLSMGVRSPSQGQGDT